MEVLELDVLAYEKFFPNPYHVFNTARFNDLNSSKCEKVYYLAFKDSKVRLGIVFGMRDFKLIAPFSAPFGGFEATSDDVRLNQIDAALNALEVWAKQNDFTDIKITLPPVFYNRNFINKLSNCLYRAQFETVTLDLNYQFSVSKLEKDYMKDVIWYNARKNLNRSLQAGLTFEKIDNSQGILAYNIIAQNRKERGFPLRMTWDQIEATMNIIAIDFFLVKKENEAIASALIFHVAPSIVQVVYWGDLPAFSEHKTMNFLSYSVFNYYKENGIDIVDIGPSTEDSIPNFGLCEFKEGIGCDISNKSVFVKKIQ